MATVAPGPVVRSTRDSDSSRSAGASGTFATVIVKESSAQAPLGSSARSATVSSPTSPSPGVPLKVRVAASKLSHAGSGVPSLRVAVIASASPSSSTKASAGSA